MVVGQGPGSPDSEFLTWQMMGNGAGCFQEYILICTVAFKVIPFERSKRCQYKHFAKWSNII